MGGGVKCWGDNTYGQVGDGTSANTRLAPVDVAGVSGASAVAAGGLHSCARVGGGLACWGLNSNGQLGDNSVTHADDRRPTSRAWPRCGFVSGGGTHSCALTAGGGVRCWGGNASGQLGDGTFVSEVAPTAPHRHRQRRDRSRGGKQSQLRQSSAGGGKCWGDNTSGQLGDDTQFQRLTPVDVSGLAGATRSWPASAATIPAPSRAAARDVLGKQRQRASSATAPTMQRLTPVAGQRSGQRRRRPSPAGQSHTCARRRTAAASNAGGSMATARSATARRRNGSRRSTSAA